MSHIHWLQRFMKWGGLAQSYMEIGISVIHTAKFSSKVCLQFLGTELFILGS